MENKLTFTSLEDVLNTVNILNTFWGFNPKERSTYFAENSFDFNEELNEWYLYRNEWTEFLFN